ncbi:hypothetical protein MMC25_003163 [Agyrium rufum]|nr:hypothetical protein [Agyrium rufum]
MATADAPSSPSPHQSNRQLSVSNTLRDDTPDESLVQRPTPSSGLPLDLIAEDDLTSHHNPSSEASTLFIIRGLPDNVTPKDLWETLHHKGEISYIEIIIPRAGKKRNDAQVRFRQMYISHEEKRQTIALSLRGQTAPMKFPVDVVGSRDSRARNDTVLSSGKPRSASMNAKSIDFGFMNLPTRMVSMHSVEAQSTQAIVIREDAYRKELLISFLLPTSSSTPLAFRFRLPFSHPMRIYEVRNGDHLSWLIDTDIPPWFAWKMEDADSFGGGFSNGVANRTWNENHTWQRLTEIGYGGRESSSKPLCVRAWKPKIDIGRWTSYLITFEDVSAQDETQLHSMREALRAYNVEVKPMEGFRKMEGSISLDAWNYMDKPFDISTAPNGSINEHTINRHLPFAVRYQLEVCLSHQFLPEDLPVQFVRKLCGLDEKAALELLEHVESQQRRVYEPMELFEQKLGKTTQLKIPSYCTLTRSATVTPTRLYFNSPTVETSNRIIRQFSQYADRFLRVRFVEEKSQGKLFASYTSSMDRVFDKIRRVMKNGILLGDRHYEFLAFGNSQLREAGAYFFAPLENLTAAHIRAWMGDFSDIRIIAKHAARIGQCFSTTRAITSPRILLEEEDDVFDKRGHCYTDGVGKISLDLARIAASELRLSGDPPSLFQFRLGGCKGVLVTWPDLNSGTLRIRPSQYKFAANQEGLEIVKCSQFAASFLNRQIIAVLSSLGTPDSIFLERMKEQLTNLELAMTNQQIALNILQREIDANQMTLTLAGMIIDGFQESKEPFVIAMLQLWRAWSIKYLKEKAKIVIEKGALLFGCTDETKSLRGYYHRVRPSPQTPREKKVDALPEVFIQLSKGAGDKPEVIIGPLLLARNPSLHPGDIRVVKGVDNPKLRHLKDVVVLPQTGDRDIASMCSGGDLDGDDYLVMWDPKLLPKDWFYKPMDHTAQKPVGVKEVTTVHITDFFVHYMKNDTLASIALAHLATADDSPQGVKNLKCLQLADLHSTAVDFPKTGIPARLPHELKPRRRPHYMEYKGETYHSSKILGQLYDHIQLVDFEPNFDLGFNERILAACPRDQTLQSRIRDMKDEYDLALQRIMAQYEIRTEFEVWSTFVLHHTKTMGDYKFHDTVGQLSSALKDSFRTACYKIAGGNEFERVKPVVAAMYKVTCDQIAQALPQYETPEEQESNLWQNKHDGKRKLPFTSFPWIFPDVLGKIAQENVAVGSKPHFVQSTTNKSYPKKSTTETIIRSTSDDTIETAEGPTHHGDILSLFKDEERFHLKAKQETALSQPDSIKMDETDPFFLLDRLAEPYHSAPTPKTSIRYSPHPPDRVKDGEQTYRDVGMRAGNKPNHAATHGIELKGCPVTRKAVVIEPIKPKHHPGIGSYTSSSDTYSGPGSQDLRAMNDLGEDRLGQHFPPKPPFAESVMPMPPANPTGFSQKETLGVSVTNSLRSHSPLSGVNDTSWQELTSPNWPTVSSYQVPRPPPDCERQDGRGPNLPPSQSLGSQIDRPASGAVGRNSTISMASQSDNAISELEALKGLFIGDSSGKEPMLVTPPLGVDHSSDILVHHAPRFTFTRGLSSPIVQPAAHSMSQPSTAAFLANGSSSETSGEHQLPIHTPSDESFAELQYAQAENRVHDVSKVEPDVGSIVSLEMQPSLLDRLNRFLED